MALITTGYIFTVLNVFLSIQLSVGQPQLSEILWAENLPIARNVYATSFLQGIQNNNLDEEIFRQFNMPDILYLNTTIGYLQVAANRCQTEEPKCDLLRTYVGKYQESLPEMLAATNLENTVAIISTPAFDAYAEHYNRVANDQDPAYMLVAIYPCSRLWNWFANIIKENTDMNSNVYRTWISGNAGGSGGSSLKEFINTYTDFETTVVHGVFHVSMEKEFGIFKEASEKVKDLAQKEEL